MLRMTVHCIGGNEIGVVDAVSVDPAGRSLVRVNDRWFEASDCVGL